MNSQDYLKDIYNDFFKEQPKEEIKENLTSIDELYINKESKQLLNKVISYMQKYKEGIEKNYIPFRIIIKADYELAKKITDIIYKNSLEFNYIDDKRLDLSLYNIDSKTSLSNYSFIELKDLTGINLLETNNKEKFFFEIENYLKTKEKSIIIITDKKQNVENFLLGYEKISKQFSFIIEQINPDIQDVYQNILKNIEFTDKQKIELLDYIKETYKNENYIEYQNELIKYISFNKKIPEIPKEKPIDEIFESLNELVGLEKVKKVLYELVDVISLKKKDKTLNINNINLHMVFLGNPGTGKTTIARIISSILYDLGYIKENKLIEVSTKDLVGQYVGQTAPKTMSIIEKSLNGVLFIDEAYTLSVKSDNSYNEECIATLIEAMENYRDKLVVIFAGYKKEMRDFLNSNSGIVSRIGYTLEFEDYTTKELKEIFKSMINKGGFKVEKEAMDYLEQIINKNRNVKNFGNARFIRNIYEKTIVKHASRVKNKKQITELKTITKEDISTENLIINEI